MKLTSESFAAGGEIPARCAFARPDPAEHIQLSDNRSPELSWSDIPTEAQSLVLICTDPDAPSSMDDFNKEGHTISADLRRTSFIHWVMVDIPAVAASLAEGECSEGITPGGKQNPDGPAGARQGINDYTGFFASDDEMKGDYFGYEGPCPPWNDELPHRYQFRLFALDLASCPVEGPFTAEQVLTAIDGHVLAETLLTGTYSLNPDVTV